jgi:uncharacterized protein YjbI with pentapeptide repeats
MANDYLFGKLPRLIRLVNLCCCSTGYRGVYLIKRFSRPPIRRKMRSGPHSFVIMIQIFDRRGFTLLLSVDSDTLQGAQLAGADLNDANLVQVDLRNADLSGASLRDADLRLARLNHVNFSNADLNGADLSKTKLEGADLRGAKLLGTKLADADLRGATVERKALLTADAREAKMEGANIV